MNIFIVGGGFTGIQLAKKLIAERNLVTLIDNDENIVRNAANHLDCTVVQADGNDLQALESLGIASAHALVCLTEQDEVNMITCSLVDTVYPHVLKIARVRNYAYYVNTASAKQAYQDSIVNKRPLYGIDFMIQPDVEAATKIVNAVKEGAINDIVTFGNSDLQLLRLVIKHGSKLCGIPLKESRKLSSTPFLVAYVIDASGQTRLPTGDYILSEGDSIGVLVHRGDTQKVLELCASMRNEIKKIVIVGAGKIGTIIARKLSEGQQSKSRLAKLVRSLSLLTSKPTQQLAIIDRDDKLSKLASERFPSAIVYRADATDEAFLREEGIINYDLAICVTHNHEMNMVLAAYLESLGVKQSIALVNNAAFAAIARNIGIDVPIPIKDVVVDSIMSHLRGTSVKEVHTITGSGLEIIECVLPEDSKVIGKRLRDISKPGEFLVLMLSPDEQSPYTIPHADTVFTVGDRVALICLSNRSTHTVAFFGNKASL